MQLPVLLLFSLVAMTLAGVATVDFASTVPQCYNHQTGGGSFNDASTPYVVESLEGGDFACGDIVSFLWHVVVADTNQITDGGWMQFHLQFTGTTTGQEGVGFSQVRGNKVYINQPGVGYVMGDGCTYAGRTGGTCTPTTANCNKQTATSYDSGVVNFGAVNNATLIRQWFSGAPPFVAGSQLNVVLKVGGVTRNDRIVVRIDVEIACDPNAPGPTGNIQGAFYSGCYGDRVQQITSPPSYLTDKFTGDISNVWAREGTTHESEVVCTQTISGGQQTVPLKNVQDVAPCATPTQMTCIDFTADMRVTTVGGTGTAYGKFNYCWTQGKMSWNYGTAPSFSSTTAIRTFDVACTSNHLSLYDTNVGPCGTCELVQQFPTSLQPQLCYNATSGFWSSTTTSESITVTKYDGTTVTTQTTHYVANPTSVQGTGVTDLWLSATKVPIQIQFNDGTVFSFYNQVINTATACAAALYTPATCTSFSCGRPLDLAIVEELSKNTDTLDQAGVRAFINLLTKKFVFGPTNVQMGYITFNTNATVRLPLSAGTSASNVGAAVNATGCNPCSGASYPSVGINAGTAMLAASTRSTATAARVILMIVNEIEEPIANINAAVLAAAQQGVYVICLAYNSGTPLDFFYAITSDPGTYGSRSQNLFYVPLQNDLANANTVTDVATRLCGLVSYSDSCTTCCQSLLCNTAGTVCGGSPCSNNAVTCGEYYADDGVTPHCDLTYVLDTVTGCCKVAFRTQVLCNPTNNASCYSKTCNRTSGYCITQGGCPDLTPGDCRDTVCVSSSNGYICQDQARTLTAAANASKPTGVCVDYRCNPLTNDLEWYDVGCTDIADGCQQRTCNLTTNQCVISLRPDPSPTTNKCTPRVCISGTGPGTGWQFGTAVTCTSPAACVNSVCDPTTGGCINTAVTCGDPTNLCATTTCAGTGPASYTCTGATTVNVDCGTPAPCYTQIQCVPGTGQCVSSGPTSCPFNQTSGCTRRCNTQTNQCEDNVCPPPPPPGCTAVCTNTVCETYECQILGAQSFCAGPQVRDCSLEVNPNDSCQYNDGCSTTAAVPGCQIKTRNCSAEAAAGKIVVPDNCHYVIQDPSSPDCCVVQQKTCPNSDPCKSASCNVANGQCVTTNLCVTTDPCYPVLCTPTGCKQTTLCQAGLIDGATCAQVDCQVTGGVATCGTGVTLGCGTTDKCKVGVCNNATKVCEFTALCSNNTADKCSNTYCNASTGSCYTLPIAAGSAYGCKKSGCDPLTGPYLTLDNTKCQDGNPCYTSQCTASGNCSRTPYDCNGKLANQSFCKPAICRDFIGCQLIDFDCFANSSVRPANDSCQTVQCVDCTQTDDNQACLPHTKNYTGYCQTNGGACFPLFALIGGLAGGVIAAIVVCGLIALALVGGGVTAAASASANPDEHAIFNNPLFKEKGMSGQAPW